MRIEANKQRNFAIQTVVYVEEKLIKLSDSTKKSVNDFFASRQALVGLLKHADKIAISSLVILKSCTSIAIPEPIAGAFVVGILVCKVANTAKGFQCSQEAYKKNTLKART